MDIWYPVNNKSDSEKPRADIMLYINAYSGKAVCFAIKMCVEREKTPQNQQGWKQEEWKQLQIESRENDL